MTPDEVLDAFTKITGVKLTRTTLTKYENLHLISLPERGGGGRGVGRWTNYPEVAVAEAVAAYMLINGEYRDFPRPNPPRVSQNDVRAVKGRAVYQYKYRNESLTRLDKSQKEEMELLFDWYNADIEMVKKELGDYQTITLGNNSIKNEEMHLIWLQYLKWAAMVWEYEYCKAWRAWKRFKEPF